MSESLRSDAIVGVIGAGAMGSGIAQVAAAAGHPVLLFDMLPTAGARALEQIRADLTKLVARGKLAADIAQERAGRIRCATTIEELAPAVLIVEAIVEDLQIKSEILVRTEALLDPAAIVTTNTSSLSVTALGAKLARPERFAGLHFFNPATQMPLVEVVSGAVTSQAVAAALMATAAAWGKTPVQCRSTPGFIVNRIARPFYGEALRLLAECATDSATLDALLRESGGFRMGPCELMDLIGHDVNFAVTRSVYDGFFQDPRYKPSLLQQEFVLTGRLGRKTGQGFFSYDPGSPPLSPATASAETAPSQVVFEGDLGPAQALSSLSAAAGLHVEHRPGAGIIRLGDLVLALTDGRTATERSRVEGPVALFDLALDYTNASRIGLACAANLPTPLKARAIGFLQALGKRVSVIDDVPGLAVMRTVAMIANEAADVLHQGVATAPDIECAMTRGANYPVGPLEWARRVGTPYLVKVMDALDRDSPDGRYRTSPLLRRCAILEQPLSFLPGVTS